MHSISKKEDIIIPFSKIGENGWADATKLILEAIANSWDDELAEPIPTNAIDEVEARIGTTIPNGLKLFYQTFGLADIGERLQALNDIGYIKDIWADVPQYGPDFTDEDKLVLPYLVSFSDYLGNGNMFCFHSETKEVYYYDHDGEPYLCKMFNTVDDYLKGCLIFAQSDLYDENVEQEDADRWAEEIVADLFGKNTVAKWKY